MKKRIIAAALTAAFLFTNISTVTAYAGGGPEEAEAPILIIEEVPPEERPFTPAGTGTVIDNATNADGKEFFTIMTPNENIFYLIIDRQRSQENVYFLNAVTEKDLLALAEQSEDTGQTISAIPDIPVAPAPVPEVEPEPTPDPVPEKGGNAGMVILLVVILLGGGAAGWYFKIYRPKQQQADTVEDYDDYEADPYGEETEEDLPPWDVEDEGENPGDGDK